MAHPKIDLTDATWSLEKVWTSLALYAEQYVKIASTSVLANSHTNNLPINATVPPDDIIKKCIYTFVKFCQQDPEFWQDQIQPIQILDTLVGFARDFPKKKEGSKALVVDFINYIATLNAINYNLTTNDLN